MHIGVNVQKVKAKVVFRVDAGAAIGAGHFMRCLALAAAFAEQKLCALFLVNKETESFIRHRSDFQYDYHIVEQENELQSIRRIVEDLDVLFFVLDGYHFDQAYRFELKQLSGSLAAMLVLLDDTNDSGQLYADVVLNPVSAAFKLGYALTAPNAKLLLGADYTLLRPEFTRPEELTVDAFRLLSECVITFGASDVAGLTAPLLAALLSDDKGGDCKPMSGKPAPDSISVITGAGFTQGAIINVLAEQHAQTFKHLHDVSNMAVEMKHAKCVISAAGGTTFELAALGKPSILVVMADNQLNAAKEQTKKGWCTVVDARHCVNFEATRGRVIEEIVSVLQGLWNNDALLHGMHKKAINAAVYNGAQKVVSELMTSL
jgi:UDP-2,4-diacetamido-2,4,6-trideoxy-beta-L-altropyranose hydrolase